MHSPGARVSWRAVFILLGIAVALPGWTPAYSQEVCTDRRDNDGDGRVDCADSDCCAEPSCLAAGCTRFKRGDVNGDGRRTVTDVVLILLSLFGGQEPLPCSDAADVDDSDTVEVADPIYILRYLFQEGPEPPPPFLTCDKDPTQGNLSCDDLFRCR